MIYLDNSATTKPCPEAIKAVNDALENNWGNPSSIHFKGQDASDLLEYSRRILADELKCSTSEIFFTGSGSAANNTAIFGSARSKGKRKKKIITTSVEHPSVNECMKRLEYDGFNVVRLKTGCDGKIKASDLISEIDGDTFLVSFMAVNNEIGAVNDIKALASAVRKKSKDVLIHVDSVQAFGKINLEPSKWGVDMMTASAHKIHGPKGVGLLYIRKGLNIPAYVLGGGQEKGMYSGTEAMPAISGFAAAVKALPDKKEELKYIKSLRDRLIKNLETCGEIYVNSPEDCLPYILNISCPGVPSQPMVNALSEKGICISAGSACSKGHRSHVLEAVGLSAERIDSAVRLSFSRFNTMEEMDETAEKIIETVKRIRR